MPHVHKRIRASAGRFLFALVGGVALNAFAALPPDSYSMPNGYSRSYNYWDESYDGSGCKTCDGAFLSGGTGDLTDGIIATLNWFTVEPPPGNGPYVGWSINPTLTFHWDSAVTVSSATFHVDDANGNGSVRPPSSVVVDGSTFLVPDPAGSAPFAFTASGLSFTGNDLVVTINRRDVWVFLSEVQFDAVALIPEPQTYLMLLAGLGLLGLIRGQSRNYRQAFPPGGESP